MLLVFRSHLDKHYTIFMVSPPSLLGDPNVVDPLVTFGGNCTMLGVAIVNHTEIIIPHGKNKD